MQLQALGYFGVRSDKLEEWADYGPRFLGLELVERTATMLKFRMDDRKQRILISSTDSDVTAFGFEVQDAAAIDALAARLEAAKVSVGRVSAVDAGLRGVADAIRFLDPDGNPLEAFHGAEQAAARFKPGRSVSGFRTGALGMGHAVLHVERAEDLVWFYKDVLGFRISDYLLKPFKAYFFHLNPRHHSLALIETGRKGIHHIMMEACQLDDVGQAYDIATLDGRVAVTLGRHTNDFMTSFYAQTPGDFMVEYGWGGRTIDPDTWTPSEMKYGGSLWGHERTWLPPEQLAAAREARARAAGHGLRQPVQVVEGSYHVGPSACAWWEAVKQG